MNTPLIDPMEYFEVFKPITQDIIPGVEDGRYVLSNFGRLFDNKMNRFSSISQRPDGYCSININTYGEPKAYLLHRIVALLFVNGDKSLIVNHLDGIKNHCIFTNLEWATYSENNIHAFENNLNVKGEDSPKAVITEEQAEMICKCLDAQELTYHEIAELCNIHSPDASSLISAIRRGESWTHISKKYEFSKHYKENGRYRAINRKK